MMRAEIVRGAGLYNPALQVAEDLDLFYRMGKFGDFANLPQTLFKLRMHKNSLCGANIRLLQYSTLFVRMKAVVEYGYSMTWGDKLYFAAQCIGSLIVPPKYVTPLFNFIRRIN
jgi:hypothetical protein